MSETLLDKLEKKPVPKKYNPIKITLNKGQIQIQTTLIDKTQEQTFNIKDFRLRIKEKSSNQPQIGQIFTKIKTKQDQIHQDKTKPDKIEPKILKPEKIKSKLKLPSTSIKSKVKTKKKPKLREEKIVLDIPATLIEIDNRPIGDRLKKKEPTINIKAPAYYLNNRKMFINFINSLFRSYNKKLKTKETKISCNTKKTTDFSLMIHQQIVRDYLNLYTPYRGLLLYHGLGAGKTCASIAIAEGMKNNKQIIIMTPASLRMNYINELKQCGDPLYKTNQYWEKISINDNKHIAQALSDILGLDLAYIRKEKGAWLVDNKKDSNYTSLSLLEQKSINNQIHRMILMKYKFINYNGMRESHLNTMIALSQEENNTANPFDNKVIIIDEAHNFVSRIVNKMNIKKKTLSKNLYELILKAENCRIVFLTGTPIINYPNEIGILFNMLRGYIKTFQFTIDTSNTKKKINQTNITKILKKEFILDYIEYKSSSNTLIVTRNPFGFISRKKKQELYAGVSKHKKGERDDESFKKSIIGLLRKNKIVINKHDIKINMYKSLPDTLNDFKSLFIDQNNGKIKNINIFKKRILGLTSYFRSAQETLLPRYEEEKDTNIIKIPMSNYQLGVYEEARAAERKEELRNARKKKKAGDIYSETTSTYRIFSRAFCNFVFPNEVDSQSGKIIKRPMPKEETSLAADISDTQASKRQSHKINIDEDFIDPVQIRDRLDNIDGRFDASDQDKLEKEHIQIIDSSYPARIKNALELLEKNAEKYLSPTGLKILSPKFLQVLTNLHNETNVGLHLIYSQFRTIEGIGILSLILKHNGFTQFKISKNVDGIWQINIDAKDLGKPAFALYTGTETVEEKEIIRNIYNGTWDVLPTYLFDQLKNISNNNNMGEIIKIFMITSSGAEGITLKNTRYVHIIEPYWHPVRQQQVIGRARRICSHQSLEEQYRTVEVFLYLMTFTDIQLYGNKKGKTKIEQEPIVSIELKLKDVSKIDRTTPLSSDEALFEISRIKQNINKNILKAVKETSIDCAIHSNSKENLICFSFGAPSVNTFSYKPSYTTEEKDVITKLNIKKITWKAYTIKIQGITYAIKRTDSQGNKKIGDIYDYDSYIQARKHGTNPILIGRTQINPNNVKKIQFLKVGDTRF